MVGPLLLDPHARVIEDISRVRASLDPVALSTVKLDCPFESGGEEGRVGEDSGVKAQPGVSDVAFTLMTHPAGAAACICEYEELPPCSTPGMEQGKVAHPEGNTGVRGEERRVEELRRVSAPPPTPPAPPVLLSPQREDTAVTK
jgi:hypothetical protein